VRVRRFDSVDLLNATVAEEIVRTVETEGARFIELSGGASPRQVYTRLGSGELRERLSPFEVIWILGDERFVDPSDERSNRRMVEETLFSEGVSPRHSFLFFETRDVVPADSALRFEEEWRRAGIAALDLAILGVGDDGHTASLFPGHEVLNEKERIARELWVPHLGMWRVTLTLPVLRDAKQQMVLASGEAKRDVLRRVESGEDLPIARVTSRNATWYLAGRSMP
jgi:6-phosphogluconolactonase